MSKFTDRLWRDIVREHGAELRQMEPHAERPRPRLASRVMAAVTRNGPASTSTSAITPSASTERTVPEKRLRAERSVPVRWRWGRALRRRTSDAGTRRRLRPSRLVLS